MLIKKNKEWNNYKNITPEKTFINRRSILKSMGFAAVSSNIIMQNAFAAKQNDGEGFRELPRWLHDGSKPIKSYKVYRILYKTYEILYKTYIIVYKSYNILYKT